MRCEKNNDFRKRLLNIHTPDIRDVNRMVQPNEYRLDNGVKIFPFDSNNIVVDTAVKDFVSFLNISMNVSARIVGDGGADIKIKIAQTNEEIAILGEMATYKGFVYTVNEKGIEILAFDERGAAQALYYLEDMMTFEKAPCLKYGKVEKKPMYSPQMIHSGYGLDEYPDEYLARVAHEGRDAIVIFAKGVNLTPKGDVDFNDLIRRSAKYGLDVYAYSYLISDMSPESPEAEAYYENTYGHLFRKCPGLKGVILVGESVEFPSKDPHVSPGRLNRTAVDGIPTGKYTSGWYPCEDYPSWLNLLKRIIRKYNADADIVFWTYNWGFQPEEARVKLIEQLPTDISLEATFEMFEPVKYDNTVGICEDYTLSFAGPGAYFKSEAEAASKRNIRLYSMTNTGGLTWDFGVIPYEPMPFQWLKRYASMEKAHNEWGLCGIMECHHYGFYPSFISKLSKHLFMQPHESGDEILSKIIKAEFGKENFNNVTKALEYLSEAICHYTPSEADQYGAFRVGPSYPFNLSWDLSLPSDPDAMFGSAICNVYYHDKSDSRLSHLGMRIHDEIASLNKMLELTNAALNELEVITDLNEALAELINLIKFIRNCVKTGVNAKKWYIMKCEMHLAKDKSKLIKILDEMESLLKEEIKNAEDTIPLVEFDSRLGWEPSMLYMTDRYHLEWKIKQVQYVMDLDLKSHKKSLLL